MQHPDVPHAPQHTRARYPAPLSAHPDPAPSAARSGRKMVGESVDNIGEHVAAMARKVENRGAEEDASRGEEEQEGVQIDKPLRRLLEMMERM